MEGLDQAAEEHPPPYDPKANGEIENTVKVVKGLARTVLHGMQRRLLKKVPPTHPVLSWLIEHVAALTCWRVKGEDGMTAYQRVRGRPFSVKLVEFCEYLRYKLNSKAIKDHSTLDARWSFGIFMGVCKTTGQYLIHDGNGVTTARTIMRVPDNRKWQSEQVEQVLCWPWQLAEKEDSGSCFPGGCC